jgi:hypothetical protein
VRFAKSLTDALTTVVVSRARESVPYPRVVALLDERLARVPRDLMGRDSARCGVHLVLLVAPRAKLPPAIGFHLDLGAGGVALALHLRRSSTPAQTGVPDGVTPGYARAIVAGLRGS